MVRSIRSTGALVLALAGCRDPSRAAEAGGETLASGSTSSVTSTSSTPSSTQSGESAESSMGGPDSTGDPGAPGCESGEPIDAPDQTWTWVEMPETRCALAGNAGFAINPLAGSTKLVIMLDGGSSACFTDDDCEAGPEDGIDDGTVIALISGRAAFDRSLASNPFADYSYVFVPYCTGDFHAGDNVTDSGTQHVGYANMTAFLERIVPTFCDVEQVVLAGYSGGGFGAAFNYPRVHDAFGSISVDLIDDAGPFMTPAFMPSESQALFDARWNFRANMPADCEACTTSWHELYTYAATKWPDDRISLVSSRFDPSIRNLFEPYTPLDSLDAYAIAIDALADEVFAPLPNAHVFFTDIPGHIMIPSVPLDQFVVDGISLEEFLRAQLEDDPAWTDARP